MLRSFSASAVLWDCFGMVFKKKNSPLVNKPTVKLLIEDSFELKLKIFSNKRLKFGKFGKIQIQDSTKSSKFKYKTVLY